MKPAGWASFRRTTTPWSRTAQVLAVVLTVCLGLLGFLGLFGPSDDLAAEPVLRLSSAELLFIAPASRLRARLVPRLRDPACRLSSQAEEA